MGYSNGIISAPVNTDDVAQALGVSSHDVGVLCTSDKINKWAKYKPTIFNSPDGEPYASTGPGKNPYWKADDGCCGLIPPNTSIWQDFKSVLLNGGTHWGYAPPTGNNWKRLADFVGYNVDAICPFGACKDFYWEYYNGNLMCFAEEPDIDSDNIATADIQHTVMSGNFSNCYFGIAAITTAGGLIAATSQWKISQGTQGTLFQLSGKPNWTKADSRIVNFGPRNPPDVSSIRGYKIYSFLSVHPFAIGQSEETLRGLGSNFIGLDGPYVIP